MSSKISSGVPDLLTVIDPAFQLKNLDHSLYDKSNPPSPEGQYDSKPLRKIDESAGSPKGLPRGIRAGIDSLKNTIPDLEILYEGEMEFQEAVSIGNLLYQLKTPAAVVRPRSAEQIASVVKLARDNNITLTVKNGGHSYAGYCLNKGGIVIDMSRMKNVEINKESTEVEIWGGCIWKEVYPTLKGKDSANIIIGGQCPMVGVSGFTLGGGLSPFSRSYGLGVDNVVEMTVVTAAGEIVTVSAEDEDPHKKDLFWALRGGGGGNFGILTKFKSKVHKLNSWDGRVQCGALTWYLDNVDSRMRFLEMLQMFDSSECPNELTADGIWRKGPDGQSLVGEMTIIYNGDEEDSKKALQQMRSFKPDEDSVKRMHWTEWAIFEEGFDEKLPDVHHHHVSFVFAQGALKHSLTKRITDLMTEFHTRFGSTGDNKSHLLWDHIGGETMSYGETDTPFPWRSGVYVATLKVQWKNRDIEHEIMKFVYKCKHLLQPWMIEYNAAYLNYIDSTVENWQDAYYGKNYPRLQRIKTHWDPTNLFKFERGIELLASTDGKPHDVPTPASSGGLSGSQWNGSIIPMMGAINSVAGAKDGLTGSDDDTQKSAAKSTQQAWDEYALPNPAALQALPRDVDTSEVRQIIMTQRIQRMKEEAEQANQ